MDEGVELDLSVFRPRNSEGEWHEDRREGPKKQHLLHLFIGLSLENGP